MSCNNKNEQGSGVVFLCARLLSEDFSSFNFFLIDSSRLFETVVVKLGSHCGLTMS